MDALPADGGFDAVFHTVPGADGMAEALRLHAADPPVLVLCATLDGAVTHADGGTHACYDALARHRTAGGRPTTCVAWGPWGSGGELPGLRPVDPGHALALVAEAVGRGEPSIAIADADWPDVPGAAVSPLVRELAATVVNPLAADAGTAPGGAARLRSGSPGWTGRGRDEVLLDLVTSLAAHVLGHASAEAVDPDGAFLDLGFLPLHRPGAAQPPVRRDGADAAAGAHLRGRQPGCAGRPPARRVRRGGGGLTAAAAASETAKAAAAP